MYTDQCCRPGGFKFLTFKDSLHSSDTQGYVSVTVSAADAVTFLVSHKTSQVHGPAVMELSQVPDLNEVVLEFMRDIRPRVRPCMDTLQASNGRTVCMNDLLFVSVTGHPIRPREYVRKAFERGIARSLNPGDLRILGRMLLARTLSEANEQPFGESTAGIVASAFGHSVEVWICI